MARNKHKPPPKGGQFDKSHRRVRASVAYRSISPWARLLIVELESFYRGGTVFMSCRQAAKMLNTSHVTAAKAIKELLNVGFISVHEQSDFVNGRAVYYRLEWLQCNGREPAKTWLAWELKQKQNR